MQDLGEKSKSTMYPSSVEKDKVHYPGVTLPLKLLNGKNVDLGDEITLTLKGKITRVEKSEWSNDFSVELRSGEIVEKPEKNETEKTLLG